MSRSVLSISRYVAPIGPPLGLAVNRSRRVVRISFLREKEDLEQGLMRDEPDFDVAVDPEATARLANQLDLYFDDGRRGFDLQLAPSGTAFQHQVWRKLCSIPAGETRTYGEIATELGRPKAARAVGRANATNPLPIVVPCHRLIGSNGSLTGFAGGLEMKRLLLAHEGAPAVGD